MVGAWTTLRRIGSSSQRVSLFPGDKNGVAFACISPLQMRRRDCTVLYGSLSFSGENREVVGQGG